MTWLGSGAMTTNDNDSEKSETDDWTEQFTKQLLSPAYPEEKQKVRKVFYNFVRHSLILIRKAVKQAWEKTP